MVYQPFKFFMSIAALLLFFGLVLSLRFLVFYFGGEGGGHVQSVVLAGVLLGLSFQAALIGFVADLLSVNRTILEDLNAERRRAEQSTDQVG